MEVYSVVPRPPCLHSLRTAATSLPAARSWNSQSQMWARVMACAHALAMPAPLQWHLGYNETLANFQDSLDQLQVEYVDLYMFHWPGMARCPQNPILPHGISVSLRRQSGTDGPQG